MPFFSVIVPIYKVESYLKECVDSILGQTFTDLECILVDDGSPDGCPAICDEYAAADRRVRVIHKENGGLSDARNAGMRIAKGEYYCFIDSDDYWTTPDCLGTMYQELERSAWKADIAVYRVRFFSEETGQFHETNTWYDTEFLNQADPIVAWRDNLKKGYMLGSAWEGCYRASFLKERDLYFMKGIRSEDTEWIIRVYKYMPKIWYTNYVFYTYRAREGSITATPSLDKVKEYAGFLMKYADELNPQDEVDYLRLCYLAYHYLVCLANAENTRGLGSKKLIKQLYRYKTLLRYDLTPKVQSAHKVYRMLGIHLTARLLSVYLKQK